MRGWFWGCTLLLTVAAAACGGGAAPAPASSPAGVAPSSAAAGPASAAPAASPASASSPAKPAASTSAAASIGVNAPSEWQQTVDAAKKEGSVSVFGPDGNDMHDVLTDAFQKQFGIQVDYVGDPGPGVPPRMSAERGAGKYLWDVVVTGTTTGLISLIPGKMLDPLEPALMLPDVKDPKTWRGGAMEFVDPDHEMLVMSPFQRGTLFINPNMVKADEFKSYKDLLDPKWKGKILLDDPRKAGPGQATFTFFYLQPDLGTSFIKALGQQQITIIKDFQQEVDMVGQGKFPVLLGT